jgi:hypothetical protein
VPVFFGIFVHVFDFGKRVVHIAEERRVHFRHYVALLDVDFQHRLHGVA